MCEENSGSALQELLSGFHVNFPKLKKKRDEQEKSRTASK